MSLFGTHSTRLYVASAQGELCKYSHVHMYVSHTFVYKVCAAANSSNRICFPFLTIKPNVDLAWKSSSRSFQYSNRTFYCSLWIALESLRICFGFALRLLWNRFKRFRPIETSTKSSRLPHLDASKFERCPALSEFSPR